jgi:hypothetical protein
VPTWRWRRGGLERVARLLSAALAAGRPSPCRCARPPPRRWTRWRWRSPRRRLLAPHPAAHGLRRREVEGQPQLVRVGDEARSILALANRASPSPVGDPRRGAAGRPPPSPTSPSEPGEDARRSAAGRPSPSQAAGRSARSLGQAAGRSARSLGQH